MLKKSLEWVRGEGGEALTRAPPPSVASVAGAGKQLGTRVRIARVGPKVVVFRGFCKWALWPSDPGVATRGLA